MAILPSPRAAVDAVPSTAGRESGYEASKPRMKDRCCCSGIWRVTTVVWILLLVCAGLPRSSVFLVVAFAGVVRVTVIVSGSYMAFTASISSARSWFSGIRAIVPVGELNARAG